MSEHEQLKVKLDRKGLVPSICQDADTGEVLMSAFMNPESIKETLGRGEMVFYSRSRQEIWHKGATSGNYLRVKSAYIDCDGDVLLFRVKPDGPACHTGANSYFFSPLTEEPDYDRETADSSVLEELFQIISQRRIDMPEIII